MSYYQENRDILLDRQKEWQNNKYQTDDNFRKEKNRKSLEYYYKHKKEILAKLKNKEKVKITKPVKIKMGIVFKLKQFKPKKEKVIKPILQNSNCSKILSNILGGLL